MRMTLDDLPGHVGDIGHRLADGTLAPGTEDPEPCTGYRATCSCGWTGVRDHPPTDGGRLSAGSEWVAHMQPLWAAAPPQWLIKRSDSLRTSLDELIDEWPLQALGVLHDVERWQRDLTERAVAAARDGGSSWAEVGAALGITRQSAHERFKAARKND